MAQPTITSIELVNFMCHSHFNIKFEKMVTCIGGRNGSGKSAIMIALGVLLGQRVQALERGSGFRSVIKNGCAQAIVRATILNHHYYKHSYYGDTILVEKRLRENNSKTYLSDSSGRLHVARPQELAGIIAEYELRFENPLNFLTQEKSKKFLNINRPEELYDFYYRGTEFKNIHEELEESRQQLQEMRDKFNGTELAKKRLSAELRIQKENFNFLSIDFEAKLKELEQERNKRSKKRS